MPFPVQCHRKVNMQSVLLPHCIWLTSTRTTKNEDDGDLAMVKDRTLGLRDGRMRGRALRNDMRSGNLW